MVTLPGLRLRLTSAIPWLSVFTHCVAVQIYKARKHLNACVFLVLSILMQCCPSNFVCSMRQSKRGNLMEFICGRRLNWLDFQNHGKPWKKKEHWVQLGYFSHTGATTQPHDYPPIPCPLFPELRTVEQPNVAGDT